MSRWIRENLGIFFLSLILAFFFWAVATEAEDPTHVAVYDTPIPVEIHGLPEDMVAYKLKDPQVLVEVKAPQSVWQILQRDDFVAYIDLSTATTGTVTVPIQVELRVKPAIVTKVSPEALTLVVEPLQEKEVPVRLRIQGTPAMGFKIDGMEVTPETVRVRGPASLVDEVTEAVVNVSIQNQQTSLQSNYQVVAVDAEEHPVQEIEVVPKTVTVHIAISQLGYIRDMPVTVGPLEGQPAPGYRIANLEFEPPVVKVFGRPEVVQSVAFLQTEPINLEGITQSLTTQVRLQMPEGLSVVQPTRPVVTVTLTVEVIRSGLTLEVTPTVHGLSNGLRAIIGPESVVVILSGPLVVMEDLKPSDVSVTLDVTGLPPGDYVLTPQVTVPNQVDIENIIPEAVPIKIEAHPEGSGPQFQ